MAAARKAILQNIVRPEFIKAAEKVADRRNCNTQEVLDQDVKNLREPK